MIVEITPEKGRKNLNSYPLGEKYRKIFKIDELDDLHEVVFIHFSPKIFSANYDFFCGMFGKSLNKLGYNFSSHYQFYSGNKLRLRIYEFTEMYRGTSYMK